MILEVLQPIMTVWAFLYHENIIYNQLLWLAEELYSFSSSLALICFHRCIICIVGEENLTSVHVYCLYFYKLDHENTKRL